MQESTLYEFPLNERMRSFMRLENSFSQIDHFATRSSAWDSQATLMVLLEILNNIEKQDIKGELTKELERNIGILGNLLDVPEINSFKLQQTLDELYTHLHTIQNINGKIAKTLREEELLNVIRQRVSIGSSISSFEIPGFYFWMNKPSEERLQQLYTWLEEVRPIAGAISLVLNLLRNSATFDPKVANSGFFQKILTSQQICQLVRIELPVYANYFPEISGNKHRVSVRFLTYEKSTQRPVQVAADIEFAMSCCGL